MYFTYTQQRQQQQQDTKKNDTVLWACIIKEYDLELFNNKDNKFKYMSDFL